MTTTQLIILLAGLFANATAIAWAVANAAVKITDCMDELHDDLPEKRIGEPK